MAGALDRFEVADVADGEVDTEPHATATDALSFGGAVATFVPLLHTELVGVSSVREYLLWFPLLITQSERPR